MTAEHATITIIDEQPPKRMPKYDAFAKRFQQAAKDRGLKTTQRALGAHFGVSEITARNWWHGEKLPGMANATKIAGKLGVNTEWLLNGVGLKTTGADAPDFVYGEGVQPAPPVTSWAPIVSFAQAGDWSEVVDSYEPGDAEHYFPIPPGTKCSASSFWTELTGRSMINTTGGGNSYPPGSFVLIDPEVRDAITGALVLARLNETYEATFKRLNVEGGRCFLEPLNTQYSVIEIDCEAQIIGTMISALIKP